MTTTPIRGLLAAFAELDRPGTVCTGGDFPFVMPGLDEVGLVWPPLGSAQARKPINLRRQSGVGWPATSSPGPAIVRDLFHDVPEPCLADRVIGNQVPIIDDVEYSVR